MDLIQEHVPLRKLTWMKVGGDAEVYAEVRSKDELLQAFAFAEEKGLPVMYLGQGSNMIVPDEGFSAVVVRLMNDEVSWDLDCSPDEALVTVEGGMILAKLIRECRKQQLNGLDNFVGIPGVVGAAVAGNIGIPAEEFGELIESVEIFDGVEFRSMTPEECDFRYRGSKLRDEYWLVWSVKLRIRKGEPPEKDEWLLKRIAKQPKGNSCGSFFKNPDPEKDLFAGKLIEECGLKGKTVGGAFISPEHANFLMNDGTGSAEDILELARSVRQEVLEKKGIMLENEVLLYDQYGKLIAL